MLSTKLTRGEIAKNVRKSPSAGYDLLESQSLALTQGISAFQSRISSWLLKQLEKQGFEGLTASRLSFLGALDCGTNHAANLARSLDISRQAVHKTVRELEGLGWLKTQPDKEMGNQKIIIFTPEGERMMACARKLFFDLDNVLLEQIGKKGLQNLEKFLQFNPED